MRVKKWQRMRSGKFSGLIGSISYWSNRLTVPKVKTGGREGLAKGKAPIPAL